MVFIIATLLMVLFGDVRQAARLSDVRQSACLSTFTHDTRQAGRLSYFFGGEKYDLPAGARIIETQAITSPAHPNRALILWMLSPKDNPCEHCPEGYTCPDYTRGHYFSGPTRVSLVDTKTNKIINTIKVNADQAEPNEDSFDVPYKIQRGLSYFVAGSRKESKPVIMRLRDLNDDGKALEFVLYDAQTCALMNTALIGYSESKDKVIHYPVVLNWQSEGKRETITSDWADRLFQQKSIKSGVWKYQVDYRGRGGTLDKYEVRYNAKSERFEGNVISKP